MIDKDYLPEDIRLKCHGIIHSASVATGGVGMAGAQIPLADNDIITPIQITMIIALAKVFERDLTKEAAMGVLKGAGAAFIGRNIAQLGVGWIPILGNVINSATAATLTEAIGWMSANQFYDEWIQEGHSPESYFEGERNSKQTTNTSGRCRDLCERAEEFINGQKDAKGTDKEEFEKLYKEVEAAFSDGEKDQKLKEVFAKLTEMYKP
mgnify:FL=1